MMPTKPAIFAQVVDRPGALAERDVALWLRSIAAARA